MRGWPAPDRATLAPGDPLPLHGMAPWPADAAPVFEPRATDPASTDERLLGVLVDRGAARVDLGSGRATSARGRLRLESIESVLTGGGDDVLIGDSSAVIRSFRTTIASQSTRSPETTAAACRSRWPSC